MPRFFHHLHCSLLAGATGIAGGRPGYRVGADGLLCSGGQPVDVLDAIHGRRSVRSFTRDPIPERLVRQVLEATVASASAGNVQPWGLVVVQGQRRVKALRALAPGIIGEPTAVVTIVLDGKRAGSMGGELGAQLAWMDVGLATQNLLLAAHSLGLGACPIGSFYDQGVVMLLDLPPHVQPVLLMALGYPQVTPPTRGRRPLGEVWFAERWGNSV